MSRKLKYITDDSGNRYDVVAEHKNLFHEPRAVDIWTHNKHVQRIACFVRKETGRPHQDHYGADLPSNELIESVEERKRIHRIAKSITHYGYQTQKPISVHFRISGPFIVDGTHRVGILWAVKHPIPFLEVVPHGG